MSVPLNFKRISIVRISTSSLQFTHPEYSVIKVALVCVLIAVASLALILPLTSGRGPGHVSVELHAVLTVVTPDHNKLVNIFKIIFLFLHSVVFTFTLAMNHARNILVLLLLCHASVSMTIARTGASHHHVIDGVVILLLDVNSIGILKILISKSV